MKLVSTRNRADVASLREVAEGRTPADGGLYIPEAWPRFADIDGLLQLPWRERCEEVLGRLLGDEFSRHELAGIVGEALDLPLPVRLLRDGTFVLELFHGPTLAFKDFGARLLAALLERWSPHTRRIVLIATSGDTGAAVAHAFWRRPAVQVVVLYPQGRVSPCQERQFATLGENVVALAVQGNFDDCQALAKGCFADRALVAELRLTSANSINFVRILAQVLYYLEGVAGLRAAGVVEASVVAVPSGNFGNLCAGIMAHRMGMPAKSFVAATNANKTVPEFLETGIYRSRPSLATLSNAMDVGAPSNWERIDYIFGHQLGALRKTLRWGSCDDSCTIRQLQHLEQGGYCACPHTAVGHWVLRSHLREGEVGLLLATAHAAKFAEVLQKASIKTPPIPPALAECLSRPLVAQEVANDLRTLKARLR